LEVEAVNSTYEEATGECLGQNQRTSKPADNQPTNQTTIQPTQPKRNVDVAKTDSTIVNGAIPENGVAIAWPRKALRTLAAGVQ
jgi:hypothetical protein